MSSEESLDQLEVICKRSVESAYSGPYHVRIGPLSRDFAREELRVIFHERHRTLEEIKTHVLFLHKNRDVALGQLVILHCVKGDIGRLLCNYIY